jgi:hypothetical protein
MNKNFIRTGAALLCVLCFAFSAAAQKKKKTTATPTATTITNLADVKAGAAKVSIQIKNVSKFVYNLGIIGRSIEDLDIEIKAGKASQKGIDTNTRNKQAVMTGLRNIQAGLAALETEFRTKPGLRAYLLKIEGIAALCAQSEDFANAGQFLNSGKPLLTLIEKLSDTLEAMP